MSEIDRCYRILELEPGASAEAIKEAYRDLAFVWHPDRYPDDKPRLKQKAQEKFKQINIAYDELKAHVAAHPTPAPTAKPSRQPPPPRPAPPDPAKSDSTYSPPHSPDREPTTLEKAQRGNEQAIAAVIQANFQPYQITPQKITFRNGNLKAMLDVKQAPQAGLASALLYLLLRKWQLQCIKSVKVYGLRDGSQVIWSRQFELNFPPPGSSQMRFQFDRWETNLLAFPVALVVAWVVNLFDLFRLLHTPFHVMVHALSQTAVAWLAGYEALPWSIRAFVPTEKSAFVYLSILAMLGGLYWSGWRARLGWTQGWAIGLAVLQLLLTGITTNRMAEQLFYAAGVGGELVLGALMQVWFYFPLPDWLRWDFWRFPLLLLAACSFWRSFWQWLGIAAGSVEIASPDLLLLQQKFGWSPTQLIALYTSLGVVGLSGLLATYATFAITTDPPRWYEARQRWIVFWSLDRPVLWQQLGLWIRHQASGR